MNQNKECTQRQMGPWGGGAGGGGRTVIKKKKRKTETDNWWKKNRRKVVFFFLSSGGYHKIKSISLNTGRKKPTKCYFCGLWIVFKGAILCLVYCIHAENKSCFSDGSLGYCNSVLFGCHG